jgi:hypothetical protein
MRFALKYHSRNFKIGILCIIFKCDHLLSNSKLFLFELVDYISRA